MGRLKTIAVFILCCLAVLPSEAMTNEWRVWETIVVNGGIPLSEQLVRSGVCYEVRDTLDLGGQTVEMPDDCKLSFAGGMLTNGRVNGHGCLIGNGGGDVIFGRQLTVADVSNWEVSLGWFDLPEDLDASGLIGALVVNPAVEVLNLAGKTLHMTYVDLHHSLTVKGEGATIVPVLKNANSYCGLFRCEDGQGGMDFRFNNLSIIGDDGVECDLEVVGDRLFLFNNCAQVEFDHVVIGNITGAYGTSAYGYRYNAGLITCFDVRKLRIENSEFFNNKCFEWICDIPIALKRSMIDVVFNDNYIHDAYEGATTVSFICNRLELRRNVVRNCVFYGSLFNVHGYYSSFTENDIRDCVYSSVFDTCEYGYLQKTSLGEIAYHSDMVECSNNYCECANGTLLVTWSRVVVMKNNYFSGMSLCNAQGCGALGAEPDTSFIVPTNESVTIIGNTCYGDNVDENKTLSYYRSFVRLASPYSLGGKLRIEGNTFQRSKHVDDYPFSICNMTDIIIKNNTVRGCYPFDPKANKLGMLKVGNTYSVYYPLDDIDVANVLINNNKILDSDDIELVVKVVDGDRLYSIKKQETNNNLFGVLAEESLGE